ncbi:hypothetical protein PO124_27245 [Bacillus licheniformis]|nr:hypothetical protein [Bacillus licheniformis]
MAKENGTHQRRAVYFGIISLYLHSRYLPAAWHSLFQGIWFSIITTVTSAIAADLIPPARRGEGLGYLLCR